MSTRSPGWLADAVLYQIYPASFADSNGDGIGDLAGVVEHLDYLHWLGVDVVWLNPCFVSPFRDGGYDITDYFTVDSRYGTNDDLVNLADQAGRRGIRILLDLVPGHTSDQHPWFVASANGDDAGAERYIWASRPVDGFQPGSGTRRQWFLPNFFAHQPALNFGYARPDPTQPWRQPVDAPGPQENRAALRQVMGYWLDRGMAGFRVDMASSLIKDDPGYAETSRLWAEQRAWLDDLYPDAALFAEWGLPAVSIPAGFHADFFLPRRGRALMSLWNNGTGTFSAESLGGPCYFEAEGRGAPDVFLADWRTVTERISGLGHAVLPSSTHDISRLACGPRQGAQLKVAMTFLLTWPTLPAIYYGDEIGMQYLPDAPEVEGSTSPSNTNRAGSRTPMQWRSGESAGFSTAAAGELYLPIDPDPRRPTVQAARRDSGSLLHLVRQLISLRHSAKALGSAGHLEVVHAGYPFVYLRRHGDEQYLVAVNPAAQPHSIELPDTIDVGECLLGTGTAIVGSHLAADSFAYSIHRA